MSGSEYTFFLLTFWYRPAYSMRQLLDSRQGHAAALVIAALFGIIQLSRLFSVKSEKIAWYLVICGFCGIAALYLFGWLIHNFGRWFGVDAQQREVRIAFGLGILPWTIIFAVIFVMLSLGLEPELIAAKYFPIVLGAYIYGFCILLLSLTAALRLSVIKTFLCLTVTILFSLFPLTLLAQFLAGYLS